MHRLTRLSRQSINFKNNVRSLSKLDMSKVPPLHDFMMSQNRMPESSSSSSSSSSNSSSSSSSKSSSSHSVNSLSFFIETYGCQMNVNDTDIVRSILMTAGHVPTDVLEEADLILANTCAIRENAESKVWNRLKYFQSIRRKRRKSEEGPPLVGVLGCMAERLKVKLLEEDSVNFVCGPDAYRDIPRLISTIEGSTDQKATNTQLSLDET